MRPVLAATALLLSGLLAGGKVQCGQIKIKMGLSQLCFFSDEGEIITAFIHPNPSMIHHPDSRVEREREREKVTKREVRGDPGDDLAAPP